MRNPNIEKILELRGQGETYQAIGESFRPKMSAQLVKYYCDNYGKPKKKVAVPPKRSRGASKKS